MSTQTPQGPFTVTKWKSGAPGAVIYEGTTKVMQTTSDAQSKQVVAGIQATYAAPTNTIKVNAAPTGMLTPSGGWQVPFADGFGQLDTTLWHPNSVAGTGNGHGDNSNDITYFNPSQVLIESDGVHLRCEPAPAGSRAAFISGYLQTQAGAGWASKGFAVLLDEATMWAFETVTQFPLNPEGGGGDQSLWMTDPTWGCEVDLFEIWLWNQGYTSQTDITWIYETGSMAMEQSYVQPVHPAVLDQQPHRWGWLFDPVAKRVTPYVDGEAASAGIPYPRSWQPVYMHLVHENNLRVAAPGFTSGSRDQVTRSIAAYCSGSSPKYTGGGIAAGTTVA